MHAYHNDNPPASWYEPLDVIEVEPTPLPINRPTAVLTPRGAVAVQVIRLDYALRELAGQDRAYILAMLRDLIEGASA